MDFIKYHSKQCSNQILKILFGKIFLSADNSLKNYKLEITVERVPKLGGMKFWPKIEIFVKESNFRHNRNFRHRIKFS